MVYEILQENRLCRYYSLNAQPGSSPKEAVQSARFAYLDDAAVQASLLRFHNGTIAKATFYIPSMHCSSCIWLLENLYKLNPGIADSKVDFLRKELAVTFREKQTSIREIVERLAAIGYEPAINLDTLETREETASHRALYLRIGVAGFSFGNIMLLSFPEYLSIGDDLLASFRSFFGILNILLALPVLLYSASEYLLSAWRGLRHRTVNIDVPLSLGILTLFGRSLYEILSGSGAGYMDSFAGLVFLLLIGKLFQKKTYDTLSFERDYKSFFPIAVTRKDGDSEQSIPLARLQVGDRILVRNQELIPADAVLIDGTGRIDYSFVTGEAEPVDKQAGDLIYAGGRQAGGAIELEVIKAVSQSYLTQLWNHEAFTQNRESRINTFANAVSKYFTFGIIAIALLAALYWLPQDRTLALNAFTAVLIIACPCALALSTPFTLGNILRILGRNQFYLKNTIVIETLAKISEIVFDKTGTLTHGGGGQLDFKGNALTSEEVQLIKSLLRHSRHPLSLRIYRHLPGAAAVDLQDFRETAGMGIEGRSAGRQIRIGSRAFVDPGAGRSEAGASEVYVAIDGELRGHFRLRSQYRRGLAKVFAALSRRYRLYLLSGDNAAERENLTAFFDPDALRFEQSPHDKLAFIRSLQADGRKVLMIGDGLNDAGALRQSDVGISIAEDLNNFFPACDAILQAGQLDRLERFLHFARRGMTIIRINFIISLLYNLIGLSFAVQGTLSPLICAVLMPLSSISVILFSTGAAGLMAYRLGLNRTRRQSWEKTVLSVDDASEATVNPAIASGDLLWKGGRL